MTTGTLVQINTSNGGLPKFAVPGLVALTPGGIAGDRCGNLKYHGGPDKAVLMLAAEQVDALRAEGYPVMYGSLGENLTVAGLDPSLWRSGQRWRIGDGEIELTTLRVPCRNLDVYGSKIKSELYDKYCKAGDVTSSKWARGGFYARVTRPGLIAAGAPVIHQSDAA